MILAGGWGVQRRTKAKRFEAALKAARDNGMTIDQPFQKLPGWVPRIVWDILGKPPNREITRIQTRFRRPINKYAFSAIVQLTPPIDLDLRHGQLSEDRVVRLVNTLGGRLEKLDLRGNETGIDALSAAMDTPPMQILWDPPANDDQLLAIAEAYPEIASHSVLPRVRDRFLGHTDPEWPDRTYEDSVEYEDGRRELVRSGRSRRDKSVVATREADTAGVRGHVISRIYAPDGRQSVVRSERGLRLRMRYDRVAEASSNVSDRASLDDTTVKLLEKVPRLGKLQAIRVDPEWERLPAVGDLVVDRLSDGTRTFIASNRGPGILSLESIRGGDAAITKIPPGRLRTLKVFAVAGRPVTGAFLVESELSPRLSTLEVSGNVRRRDFGPHVSERERLSEVRGWFPDAIKERGFDAVLEEVMTPISPSFAGPPLTKVRLHDLGVDDASLRTLPESIDLLSLSNLLHVTPDGIADCIRASRPKTLHLGYGLPWSEEVVAAIAESKPRLATLSPGDDFDPAIFTKYADRLAGIDVAFDVLPSDRSRDRYEASMDYVRALPGSRPRFEKR